ncbi:MAG: acetoin utilization protein AcuC, partial [Thioalkalispiraceae bacterium]
INKIAYVDIDAHHGDGVFYSFEDEPDLCFIDMHEDGRYLYPGTGAITETGKEAAQGTKLNIPMPMYANDTLFFEVWEKVEAFLKKASPEFILLQCGADSIKGDPITHMEYSEQAHAHAAQRLCVLADELCNGRLVAMGGGGYNLDNLAKGWTAVVDSFARNTD